MNAVTRIPAPPELSTFNFDGHEVRFATLDDGPQLIAKDLCAALKLSNPSVSLRALDPDERSKIFLGPRARSSRSPRAACTAW
ncbi:BRO-N domain-containing protein [Methylobacterium pseudosasicola]|uniref:Uncharacterized protein n=1 Tax=Methylobacterium pseudosasicola TaxID=582667 RepID=A0A1I4QNM0_9HYPH|nr:hypothetical protein [Methylobacterium pseudosasicola]SFM41305.1 hypothetical protein SAMN05192568_103070 [Methylobacterium pseudosasicola]